MRKRPYRLKMRRPVATPALARPVLRSAYEGEGSHASRWGRTS